MSKNSCELARCCNPKIALGGFRIQNICGFRCPTASGWRRGFGCRRALAELTPPSVAPAAVTLTEVGFNGALFEVTGTGFDPGLMYQLRRSVDGINFTAVGPPFTPGGTTHTANDPAPFGSYAIYQFFSSP